MKLSDRNLFWCRVRSVLPALVIIVASWAAFSPAVHGDWLWDDNTEIVRNLDLRGPSALWKIWVEPMSPDYFPIKATVQWLQWQFWQDQSTAGYHLSNICLHSLGALLLWRVLRKLGVRYAWIGGILFAVHPAVVESVAWIAELKNVLSLPPLLLAFSAWLDFDEQGRRIEYVKTVGWFVIAMLCKSSVVMFPCFLLVHAWWKRSRISFRDLKTVSGLFVVSLFLGFVTVWFQQHRAIDSWEIPLGGVFDRIVGAGRALAFYAFKSVWPYGLMPVYPLWTPGTLALWSFVAWGGLTAGVTGMWIRRATWGRHALLALGWFVLNLLPVLGFAKMSFLGIAPVADHFMYLSLAGFAGFFAVSIEFIEQRLPEGFGKWPVVVASLICGVLVWQSRSYASVFVSPEAMWVHTLRGNPRSWIAQNNLGVVLQQQDKWQDSVAHIEAAVAINPRYATARINLGNTYARLGRWPEAAVKYSEALQLEPDSFEAHFNFANGLVQVQRFSEAIEHFRASLRISPDSSPAHFNLANAFLETGRASEAVGQYVEALRCKPDSFEAHLNLGNVFAATNHMPEAIIHFEAALRLSPQSADAHFSLADGLAQSERFSEGAVQYEQALALSPSSPAIHSNYAHVLMRLGRTADAVRHFQEALRLDPNDQDASDSLRVAGQIR